MDPQKNDLTEQEELKIPYRTVVGVDFADLACGIFLKGKSL